jgi:hypothetical protein
MIGHGKTPACVARRMPPQEKRRRDYQFWRIHKPRTALGNGERQ